MRDPVAGNDIRLDSDPAGEPPCQRQCRHALAGLHGGNRGQRGSGGQHGLPRRRAQVSQPPHEAIIAAILAVALGPDRLLDPLIQILHGLDGAAA